MAPWKVFEHFFQKPIGVHLKQNIGIVEEVFVRILRAFLKEFI